jgi:hypothetical protein
MNRFIALAVLALALAIPAKAADDPAASLATNLVNISDFSDEFAFVDLMRGARDWIPGRTGCFDCRTPGDPVNPACVEPNVCPVTLPLDADGYVTALDAGIGQIARTVIYAGFNTPGRLPTGRYTLLFDGAGNMTIDGASNVNTQAGRIEFDLNNTSQNITINILSTTLGNHIRNMRMLPPGGVCSGDERRFCNASTPCGTAGTCQLFTDPEVAAAQLFHPNFLANTEPYRLIRFMDWMETNSSPIQEFADYPTLTSAFWHRVPTEVMAELGNRLSSDIWVNIPHLASDAFVDEFATRLRDNFRADRKIFVEYSNENWNGIFRQNLEIPRRFCPDHPDLINDCLQDRIPDNDIPCETDPANNFFNLPEPAASACFQALVRAWGDRSVEIFDRFDAVFGASARDRVVRVIASQAAQADLSRQVLVGGDNRPTSPPVVPANRTDAFAIAPYFGTEYCTPSDGVNPDNFPGVYANLDSFMADVQTRALPRAIGFMTSSRSMLQNNFGGLGIRMIAYEGGQHLAGIGGFQNNATCNSIFDAANADPRMGPLYTSYLDAWMDNGDEFAHFYNVGRWGRFGRWGALEHQDQDPATSPKFMAIMGFIDDNPCWWPDCIQDGSEPPPDFRIFGNGFEAGSAPPPPPPPTCDPVQLLNDPGLEATTIDGGVGTNAFWGSTSTNFTNVFCSSGNCPPLAGIVPRGGNFFAWFGGINAAETSTLTQTVTIPTGSERHLNFFMKRVESNEPFNAELRIKVNGATQRTFVEQAGSDPDYVARTVNLSAFATGGSHTIEFEYDNPEGSGRSDFLVDDISLTCTPVGD